MLDTDTKRRIDTARDILVGKVPDPKSQVEQITIALIYKFMDDMDAESEEFATAGPSSCAPGLADTRP
jgi:type I restriction enzyme M protein